MTAVRRWYEHVLGVALVLVGLICVLPLALILARHIYTIGLNLDSHALSVFAVVTVSFGVLAGLGGIALLRRL